MHAAWLGDRYDAQLPDNVTVLQKINEVTIGFNRFGSSLFKE